MTPISEQLLILPGIDRIRKYSKDGRFGEAQSRIEQALSIYPGSEELHDLLLDLVTRQPDLKGWAELLLAQIQDDTGKREATLARLRGAPLPASDAPVPVDKSDDVVAAPDKELPVSPDQLRGAPLPASDAPVIPAHLLALFDGLKLKWRDVREHAYGYVRESRDEIKALKADLLAVGAPVPKELGHYLALSEEVCEEWAWTSQSFESSAKGLYRQAWAEVRQADDYGRDSFSSDWRGRLRPQLVAVRKAEDELRLIMTQANPKVAELHATIATYLGLVRILSPDDTLHDDQLTTLVVQARGKLEELIEGRFQQASEEYDASLRTARTLRNVIDRLEVALDILENEVIFLDPNHSDALGLQRKVKSRLEVAMALDGDIKDFPKPGDDSDTTGDVDGLIDALGILAGAGLDNLSDAVKFRSQVVDYCVKRAEALVAGASAGNAADQIWYAEAWLGR